MFRHCVLMTFTPETSPEQISAVADALRALPAEIPELKGYVVGVDAGIAEGEGNAHIAVVADCDDVDGWRTYREHPAHRRVVADLLRPHLANRTAVQHEL